MAALNYSDLLVRAQDSMNQGIATSSTAMFGGAFGSGIIGGWNLGYSPSTNTVQYYRQDDVAMAKPVSPRGTLLERLRSEIKTWHGDVLKVAA